VGVSVQNVGENHIDFHV